MQSDWQIDIGSIGPTGMDKPPSPNVKEREDLAEDEFTDEHYRQVIEKLRQENKNLEATRDLRKQYATCIFKFLVLWSIALLIILVMCGFNFLSYKLSDNVLMTLIGGTTANVIGLVLVIAKGLFPSNKD